MKTPLSRAGLALALFYCLTTIACLFVSLSASSDQKGRFVFMQIPIALQGALLQALGLGEMLTSLNWFSAYVLLGLPTVYILYVVGRFFGRLLSA